MAWEAAEQALVLVPVLVPAPAPAPQRVQAGLQDLVLELEVVRAWEEAARAWVRALELAAVQVLPGAAQVAEVESVGMALEMARAPALVAEVAVREVVVA